MLGIGARHEVLAAHRAVAAEAVAVIHRPVQDAVVCAKRVVVEATRTISHGRVVRADAALGALRVKVGPRLRRVLPVRLLGVVVVDKDLADDRVVVSRLRQAVEVHVRRAAELDRAHLPAHVQVVHERCEEAAHDSLRKQGRVADDAGGGRLVEDAVVVDDVDAVDIAVDAVDVLQRAVDGVCGADDVDSSVWAVDAVNIVVMERVVVDRRASVELDVKVFSQHGVVGHDLLGLVAQLLVLLLDVSSLALERELDHVVLVAFREEDRHHELVALLELDELKVHLERLGREVDVVVADEVVHDDGVQDQARGLGHDESFVDCPAFLRRLGRDLEESVLVLHVDAAVRLVDTVEAGLVLGDAEDVVVVVEDALALQWM